MSARSQVSTSTDRPVLLRPVSPGLAQRIPVIIEDLPAYSAQPAYESVPRDETVVRTAVRTHEKKIKRDLKEAQKAEIQCARIKKILPQIYEQLNAAVAMPRQTRPSSGPATLRRDVELDDGVQISFKSRGIDQKALRDYLPALLSEYQQQVMAHETVMAGSRSDASALEPSVLSRHATDSILSRNTRGVSPSDSLEATNDVHRPALLHSATTSATRYYDPERMSVKAGYFEDYSQKIYFSKNFANLWKKKESGKRENITSGIAMVIIGVKVGLPIFDLFTFATLDLPRLALQGITGKQKLKLHH